MAFITIAGEQLIALKQGAGQVLQITDFVLANIPALGAEPANRIEALPPVGQIVDTKAVTHQGYVNGNQVVYSLALDSTIGDYDFNWVGLKSAEGTLVACEHIPLTQKRKTVGAVAGNNLTRNFLLAFSGATVTTAIAVPASTWQIDFTTRLLQLDDRERLSNLDDYGAAAFYGDGFKVSLASGSTYNIAAGLGYVGGIRCEKATLTALNAGSLPKGIWMDVSLQGDINGVVPVIVLTASSSALVDNTDGLGFKHYLTKIADIAAGGAVTDLRPSMVVTQSEAEIGTGTAIKRWTPERVNQAHVRRNHFRSLVGLSANTILTNNDVGKAFSMYVSLTVTLPKANSVYSGETITFTQQSGEGQIVQAAPGDRINQGVAFVTSITFVPYQSFTFVSNGGTDWYLH